MSENSHPSAEEQRAQPRKRRGRGRPFQPGQSGNPGGRPSGELGRLIREHVSKDGQKGSAVMLKEFWFNVMENAVPGMEGEAKIQDMQRASEVLAERGWGKATQPLEHTGADGGRLSIHIDLGAGT